MRKVKEFPCGEKDAEKFCNKCGKTFVWNEIIVSNRSGHGIGGTKHFHKKCWENLFQ